MYPSFLPNGYHNFSPVHEAPSVIIALVNVYKKRAKQKIDIKEYRKLP